MLPIILIFVIHWVSDFLCQTHEMSLKKSKSILWLSYHVIVYTLMTTFLWSIFFGNMMINPLTTILLIFGITFITHWITDYFTSRWTSRLWEEKQVHNFFVVIGLDQLIHATTLLITFNYLIHIL
jgi:hypothetical protein